MLGLERWAAGSGFGLVIVMSDSIAQHNTGLQGGGGAGPTVQTLTFIIWAARGN